MKKLLTVTLITIISTFAAFAQNSKAEQEILNIHRSLDEAYLKQDIAIFERVTADDYVFSDPYGSARNRPQSLEQLRKEWADAKFKVVNATTDNPRVKVNGNMALVTADWTFSSVPADNPNVSPHLDKGRYTGVYERRGGRWMLVAEHYSEAPHDRKIMEQEVMKAGQEYVRLIKNQDGDSIARLLADDYTYTNEQGRVRNKAQDLADYKNRPIKFEIFELSDQKVRVIGNNAAIETGTVRYKGTDADGKPFDGSDRYTTTWVWRDGRWQIAADHTSTIKP